VEQNATDGEAAQGLLATKRRSAPLMRFFRMNTATFSALNTTLVIFGLNTTVADTLVIANVTRKLDESGLAE
jgi:hypothetical protein